MSIRRLFALTIAIILVVLVTAQLSLLPAQQPERAAAQKRCIGIATSVLRSQNPVVTRLYRVFDDGSVETYDDGAPGARWTELGK
ncbi:MAG TPA: hypothetical protein VJ809_07170 [Pirellulales bacterium]|jgi:hypothetical protein|nr:hypothetical protein [Pirellulales bacterium]